MCRGVRIVHHLMCVLLITLLYSFSGQAQTRSMGSDGIIGKLEKIIDLVEGRGMEVVRIEADIIRQTKETRRQLDPNFTYTIAAVGSDRIEDLDIEVYKKVNGSWRLVGKDADTSSIAVVEVKPTAYSEYAIRVKVYKFKPSYSVGHYGLAIIHD